LREGNVVGKNGLLERQKIANQAYFEAGLQMGRQQIIDMLSVVLNSPKVMARDTFGKKRLPRVIKAIGEAIDTFQKAWEKNDETDYYRTKLDELLTKAYGVDMVDTFEKRYEYCCDYDYKKGKWKK
jgi:hypothetical protein